MASFSRPYAPSYRSFRWSVQGWELWASLMGPMEAPWTSWDSCECSWLRFHARDLIFQLLARSHWPNTKVDELQFIDGRSDRNLRLLILFSVGTQGLHRAACWDRMSESVETGVLFHLIPELTPLELQMCEGVLPLQIPQNNVSFYKLDLFQIRYSFRPVFSFTFYISTRAASG